MKRFILERLNITAYNVAKALKANFKNTLMIGASTRSGNVRNATSSLTHFYLSKSTNRHIDSNAPLVKRLSDLRPL